MECNDEILKLLRYGTVRRYNSTVIQTNKNRDKTTLFDYLSKFDIPSFLIYTTTVLYKWDREWTTTSCI